MVFTFLDPNCILMELAFKWKRGTFEMGTSNVKLIETIIIQHIFKKFDL